MPLLIRGIDRAAAHKRATEVLEKVGLSQRLTHRPSELSGGEQQRVAIARAIVGSPKILLADEPTGNLDAATAEQVTSLIISLAEELNNLTILVTHSRELATRVGKVYSMSSGGNLIEIAP